MERGREEAAEITTAAKATSPVSPINNKNYRLVVISQFFHLQQLYTAIR